MNLFTSSFYSDSTLNFVSKTTPKLGEKISIRFQLLDDPEVEAVFLMRLRNGATEFSEMNKTSAKGALAIYEVQTDVNEPRLSYHFLVAKKDIIYYYTQAGVTTYVPDNADNFVILASFNQPEWVDNAVFYQIFPSAWGNLYNVIEHIPYLKELGVNVIYLNPIFTAPSYHKYDCSDYFHVDECFGGDKALEELSKALHKNDMRLILDISINHTGLENKWCKEKPHFYFKDEDGTLMGWAGYKSLPVLDYRNEELRDLVYRNPDSALKKWLKPPYNIDGWRFDVADVFARNDSVQIADEVWREVCDAIREVKPEAFIIGEHWGDCSNYLQGDLWNTPMNYYGFGRIIRQFIGLPELFVSRNDKLAAVKYKMTAEDVVRRTTEHYSKLPGIIGQSQMNLIDSHDVPRIHNYGECDLNKVKAAVIAQLLWMGIPCIYYGDEIGIDGYTSHDAGFRYEMKWDSVDNNYFDFYKKAISFRKDKKAFSIGSSKVIYAKDYCFAVARFYQDEMYLGAISMEDSTKEIKLPIGIIGAKDVESYVDVFGKEFQGHVNDAGELVINIEANSGLLFKLISY